MELDNAGAAAGKAELQSFGTNNFVLEIQDQFVTDLLVHYWVITGLDNAEIGSFTPTGTAPVNQTVDNAGNFQPDITFSYLAATTVLDADLSGAGADTVRKALLVATSRMSAGSR